MSELLENGFEVKTVLGETVIVEKHYDDDDDNEQYNSYFADYKNQEKTLVWFKKEYLKVAPETFYEDFKQDLDRKSSNSKALRLLDITEYKNESFGYITDHRPQDYPDLIKKRPHYLGTPEPDRDDNPGIEER